MNAATASLAALAPDGRTARALMRSGRHAGHTAGMAQTACDQFLSTCRDDARAP